MREVAEAMNFLQGRCEGCGREVCANAPPSENDIKVWCEGCLAKRVLALRTEKFLNRLLKLGVKDALADK